MSNYTKATNFASKDTLPVGDANKKVKGSEIDTEFNAISDAIATKADKDSPTFTGTPISTTAAAGTDTTQIATTAFVQAELSATGIIDTDQLAADAVTAAKIEDSAVGTDALATGAVTTVKLGSDAVTADKIADGAVDTEHLAADSVTSAKIEDDAIGKDQLDYTVGTNTTTFTSFILFVVET